MGQITIDEMHKSLFDYAQAVSDENLMTESKTVVGAINEIYGKRLIANAIGSPLTKGDTFAAMESSINRLTTDFRNALALKGVNAPTDKFETLIGRIDEIVQSGNVLNNQCMVSGEYTLTQKFGKDGVSTLTVPLNLDFEPEYFVICIPKLTQKSGNDLHPSYAVLTPEYPTVEYFQTYMSASSVTYYNVNLVSYDSTSCVLKHVSEVGYVASGTVLKWYAIGSTQLPNNGGERTIIPSTTDQVLPYGYYSGNITVKGDPNLIPENIVNGKSIFGVVGTAQTSATTYLLKDGGDESLYTYVNEIINYGNADVTHRDGYLRIFCSGSSYQTNTVYFNLHEEIDLTNRTAIWFDLTLSGGESYTYFKFGVYKGTGDFTEDNSTLAAGYETTYQGTVKAPFYRGKYRIDVSNCTGIHKVGIYLGAYGSYTSLLELFNIELE